MHAQSETHIFPYSAEQLYTLVADVPSYPEFIPWCKAARIITQESETSFIAELLVRFNQVSEKYTSRVTLTPPSGNNGACRIDVHLVSGPFSHLENHWQFTPTDTGCTVQFDIAFQFKSRLLDKLLGHWFERASSKMIAAFSDRADVLYGA